MMMVMVASADRLRQILDAGELAALGGVGEVGGELIELVGRGSIAVRLGGLGRALQIGGDLLRNLLIFRRVGLLELLQLAHHLGEGRKLGAIRALGR